MLDSTRTILSDLEYLYLCLALSFPLGISIIALFLKYFSNINEMNEFPLPMLLFGCLITGSWFLSFIYTIYKGKNTEREIFQNGDKILISDIFKGRKSVKLESDISDIVSINLEKKKRLVLNLKNREKFKINSGREFEEMKEIKSALNDRLSHLN